MASTSYELPLSPVVADDAVPKNHVGRTLSAEVLAQNIRWFCRLRTLIVCMFLLAGLLSFYPVITDAFDLRGGPYMWAFMAACVLAVANLSFMAHAHYLHRGQMAAWAEKNLCFQILLDLVVLTFVVHYVGSVETFAAFGYLFHIVLACVFFPPVKSFLVTAAAALLYIACVLAEDMGIISDFGVVKGVDLSVVAHWMNVIVAISIWFVVWYLTSHLSKLVRKRDNELAATNVRLLELQEERSRHMLRTTHELKAPFAAIHANVQLLMDGYCGKMPEEADAVLSRISNRCRRLASEIKEMLQLANLEEVREENLVWGDLDLVEILRWCINQNEGVAEQRDIVIEEDLQSVSVYSVADHLKMMFLNLIVNAISYSKLGGKIWVASRKLPNGHAQVSIRDEGIGISEEKLPHVFDEYFRTAAAVKHNSESTGLGLAIVRNVVRAHGIRIQVESEVGVGTKFTLEFPAFHAAAEGAAI